MNKTIIPVIFRLEKDSKCDVVAFMPTIPASHDHYVVTCYAHIGQHGAASIAYYLETKKATIEQYINLYEELKEIYNDETTELKVYQSWTQQHDIERIEEIKRLR